MTAVSPELLLDVAAQGSEESPVMTISVVLPSWKSSQGLSGDAGVPQPTYWERPEPWFWMEMVTMGSDCPFPMLSWGAKVLPQPACG